MELLDSMIEHKSDAEIKAAYEELVSVGKILNADLLRAKFIRSRALRPEKVVWTHELESLLKAEARDISNRFFDKQGALESQFWEFKRDNARISRIAGFMLMSLHKSGFIDSNVSELAFKLCHKELFIITGSHTKVRFTDLLLSQYLGKPENIEQSFSRLLMHLRNNYLFMKKNLEDLYYFEDIHTSGYVERIETALTEYHSAPKNYVYEKDRFSYAAILASFCCSVKGDIVSAKYFLVKAIEIMQPEDFLRDILIFIEKEMD